MMDANEYLDKLLKIISSCRTKEQVQLAERLAHKVLFNIKNYWPDDDAKNTAIEFFLYGQSVIRPIIIYKYVEVMLLGVVK